MKQQTDQTEFERKIIIGLIVSDRMCKAILPILDARSYNSKITGKLTYWIKEYFDQYEQAPGRDIENIFYKKLQNDEIGQDDAEELEEDILPKLNEEYENWEEFDSQYLIDQTVDYFNHTRLKKINEQIAEHIKSGDWDEVERLKEELKPTSLDNFDEQTLTAGDLFDMEIKGPNWLIKDLIPKGLTIMGGRSKVGKSYFLMNLVLPFVQRKDIFNEFRAQKGQVLYLSLEDPKKRFVERMREIDQNPDKEKLNDLHPFFQWEKLKKGGITQIKRWLEKQKSPKLVVIDTIAKVWDQKTSTGGGRMYGEEYNIYSPLSELAKEYDVSIIVTTHTTKTKAADIFDQILGGMGTQANADNLVVISDEINEAGKKMFSIRGKDMGEQHMAFDVSDMAQWIFLGEAKEVQKSKEKQEVYDLLAELGPMTHQEIRQTIKNGNFNVSYKSIQNILRNMVYEGHLEQPKKYGQYAVAGHANSKVKMKRVK